MVWSQNISCCYTQMCPSLHFLWSLSHSSSVQIIEIFLLSHSALRAPSNWIRIYGSSNLLPLFFSTSCLFPISNDRVRKKNDIAWFLASLSSWCLLRDKSCYFALNLHLTCWSQCQRLWGPMACESFYPGHWLFAQIWVSGPSPSASSQASAGAKQLGSLGVVASDSPGQWH